MNNQTDEQFETLIDDNEPTLIEPPKQTDKPEVIEVKTEPVKTEPVKVVKKDNTMIVIGILLLCAIVGIMIYFNYKAKQNADN